MLSLLQSIFGRTSDRHRGPDTRLIERATERVVGGTDPRLRAVSGYRQRLRPAVIRAVNYTTELVDALPPPIELSRQRFGEDDRIRSFFVSMDHIDDFLARSLAFGKHLETRAGLAPDNVHALLLMIRRERNVLGMELDGDLVRRDVAQAEISFTERRLAGVADTESGSRDKDKRRVFDFFIEYALRNILAVRAEEGENRNQQKLLAKKLHAMETADWGIDGFLNQEGEKRFDVQEVESEVARLESELQRIRSKPLTLDHYLVAICQTLEAAPDLLFKTSVTLKMDRMGKKSMDDARPPAVTLELDEYCTPDGRRIIALPIFIPFRQIPARPDFLSEVSRYL